MFSKHEQPNLEQTDSLDSTSRGEKGFWQYWSKLTSMKLIIPMAGRGSRLRPHTLTTAKPLIKVAGNSILLQLVKDAVKLADEPIEEMAFYCWRTNLFFGKENHIRIKCFGSGIWL